MTRNAMPNPVRLPYTNTYCVLGLSVGPPVCDWRAFWGSDGHDSLSQSEDPRLRILAIWSPSLCLLRCYHVPGLLVEAALACGTTRTYFRDISCIGSTFLWVLLPVRTSVIRSVTATSRPLFTSAPPWPVSGDGGKRRGPAGSRGRKVERMMCKAGGPREHKGTVREPPADGSQVCIFLLSSLG
ncbi:unnamed protein product [Tetraodon nigroviridis]|uniref:(spotted green pufferfish) hypothetical protein n=1 Tax=Tetraodon nigroviridis TaxID=99883 RepID=Q4SL53_TETNG|nr:unnamed protein product [Tetraodon nigroviridis]